MLGNISVKKSEPIILNSYLIPAVSNVICSLLMSVRFRKDEPRFLRLIASIEEGFRLFTVVGAAAFMPFLRFLPHFSRGFRSLKHNFHEMLNFSRQVCTKIDLFIILIMLFFKKEQCWAFSLWNLYIGGISYVTCRLKSEWQSLKFK